MSILNVKKTFGRNNPNTKTARIIVARLNSVIAFIEFQQFKKILYRVCNMQLLLKSITARIPEFCLSHWLLRLPLAVVFIQMGLSKFPVTLEDAEAFELPYLVWWVVAYGETGAGIGLLVGGLFAAKLISISFIPDFGDMITRFSGITICSITTGIIWVSQPESLLDVILYDNLHVFFWVCGLYFALRGNRT